MNNTIKQIAGFFDSQNLKYKTSDENENVIWLHLALPSKQAAPLVFISYNEENQVVTIMAGHIVHVTNATHSLMLRMNAFNADPEVFGCKMFIDFDGELTVSYRGFVHGEGVAPQIISLVDVVLTAVDRHYQKIVELFPDEPEEAE